MSSHRVKFKLIWGQGTAMQQGLNVMFFKTIFTGVEDIPYYNDKCKKQDTMQLEQYDPKSILERKSCRKRGAHKE